MIAVHSVKRSRLRLGCAAIVFVAISFSAAAQDWQPVIAQLRDAKSSRKIDALERLSDAHYTAAAEYVAPLVTDPDDAVQFAAIDTELTFFLADTTTDRKGQSGGHSRAQAAFETGPLGRSAQVAPGVLVDQLLTATADGNARVRFDAMHALGFIAEPPLTPDQTRRVMTGLQQGDAVMRMATARVLGRLRAVDAGDALIGALNDSNGQVQEYATEALGLLRNDRAVQALTDRLNYHGKGTMAIASLQALARIAHPSSRDVFRARLTDQDPAVRRAAVEGVARTRDRASLDRVRTMAQSDAAAAVKLAALFALDRFGEPQITGICASVSQPTIGAQARDYLLEAGPSAAPAVSTALATTKDPAARAELIRVLGFIGGASDAQGLEPMTKDVDPRVARAAANAIARLRR